MATALTDGRARDVAKALKALMEVKRLGIVAKLAGEPHKKAILRLKEELASLGHVVVLP